MDFSAYIGFPIALVVILTLIMASVKILREYERAVVFTLGRFSSRSKMSLMAVSGRHDVRGSARSCSRAAALATMTARSA
jgi:regulator of protease activity HflC (stomatin/prohibitin superfamily)